ncbi:MAG: TonB-dependent receptor, partial [Pontixanthobacter sp.]
MQINRLAKGALLATTAFVITAAPALAQDDGNEREAASDIIIVTANKREQNLQATPIAITAVSKDSVELLGISETKDLAAIAPNVSVNGGTTNATSSVVTIRGIPTAADEALGFDSPIGIYVDGVYLARSAASSFEIADIERIEVLRGPQGTLFGRNTTGGAINYISSRPSDEASFKLKLGYGNYNRKTARAILNSGDLGGVRMTLGYLHKARDGVVDNLLEQRKSRDPGSYEINGARWAVEADLSDKLMLTNVFDWTKISGVPHAAQLSGVGNGVFRPNVVIDGNTFSQVQPAPVGAYLAGATALDAQCGAPLASVSLSRLDSICLNDAVGSEDTIWGNMTRLELDLDNVTIRSTTAFRKWKNRIAGSDLDGLGTIRGALFSNSTLFNGFAGTAAQGFLPFVFPNGTPQGVIDFVANSPVPTTTQPLFAVTNNRQQDQFSQELEIVGGSGTAFEWVLGGFYFEESGSEVNPQTFAFVLDTNQAVFSNFGGLSPIFQAANPARYRAVAQSSTLGYSVDATSYAIYGQGTLRPGGADGPLGITLGLRYSWDEKNVARSQNGAAPFTTAEQIALNTQSANFSQPTGHITIDYEVNPDLNVYAKASRGYRSGGFNLRQSTQVDNPATTTVDESVALIPFNEEKIDAFEIGAKGTFGPLRVNAAAFYNVYKDLQATVPIPIQGGGSFGTQVVNAGEIQYLGVEIEGVLKLSNALSIDGSYGYVGKDVKQFPAADINGVVQNIASVITPGNSPDHTANAGVTYSDYIGSGDAKLTARAGWTYTSATPFFPNPLSAPFQSETAAGARSLFNAQLRLDGVSLGNGPEFSILFWGKNILNEEYVSRGIDYGQLGFGQVI